MALLEQLTLIELKPYVGRHRTFIPSETSIFANKSNKVAYEEFPVEASSVQPIDGHTLQALDEGYRSRASYQFWTKTKMSGLEQNTTELPDQINIDGEWYSIYNFKDWTRTSFLSHHHCVAIREDVNNSRTNDNTQGDNYGQVLV